MLALRGRRHRIRVRSSQGPLSQVVVFRRRGGIVPPVAAARDRTVAPPLSEGAIEEWSLDPPLCKVHIVKKLADKIDRKMQELSDGKE